MRGAIDGHVHLQLLDQEPMVDGEHRLTHYLAAAERAPVDRFGVLVMAPVDDLDRTRRLNDEALTVAVAEPRAFVLCSVHPYDDKAALSELDRLVAAGARGVKLHPNTQQFDVGDPRVAAVVRRAGERGLPLLSTRSRSPTPPSQTSSSCWPWTIPTARSSWRTHSGRSSPNW